MKFFQFIKKNSKTPYKLVFLNKRTLEEDYSTSIKIRNFLLVFLLFILIILVAGILIKPRAFFNKSTPSTSDNTEELVELQEKLEELEEREQSNNEYIEEIQKIFNGESPSKVVEENNNSTYANNPTNTNENIVENNDANAINEYSNSANRSEINTAPTYDINKAIKYYFTPLRGTLTHGYSANNGHFAQDIAAPKGEPIKSIADGVVLFADWTSSTGYVVMIQHPNNVISVYKHNSQVYKKVGDNVRTGEVIAAVGNTGELTTGPHLHFEIWINGVPKDPKKYISF